MPFNQYSDLAEPAETGICVSGVSDWHAFFILISKADREPEDQKLLSIIGHSASNNDRDHDVTQKHLSGKTRVMQFFGKL